MSTETRAPADAPKVAPQSDGVEDLFDFASAPAAPAAPAPPMPAAAPARPAADHKHSAPAPEKHAAAPAPAAPAAAASPIPRWVIYAGAGLLASQAAMFGVVMWRMETTKAAVVAPPVAVPPADRTPRTVDTNHTSEQPHETAQPTLGTKDRDPHALPDAPVARSPLDAADELLRRGFYAEARRRYFEVLLTPPAGEAGRELVRVARLRIAQCLARESAADNAPIRLRFASIFDAEAAVRAAASEKNDSGEKKVSPASEPAAHGEKKGGH